MAHNSRAPFGASHRGEKGLWMTVVNGQPHAIVYTYGSCVAPGANDAASGAACFFGFGNELNNRAPSDMLQTKERAQWTAVIEGLEAILEQSKVKRVQVRTTADFVVKTVKESFRYMKQRGWKTAGGEPVVNGDLMEQLDAALGRLDHVDWVLLGENSQDRFLHEAESLADKEAAHWHKYFRGYDKMYGD